MRDQGSGRILITGSIAGFMAGSFQGVYNATKAYLNSFSFALGDELKDSGVTVTCLVRRTPSSPSEPTWSIQASARAEGRSGDVARVGYDAMMDREGDVVSGFKNKAMAASAKGAPAEMFAEQHRKMAESGIGQAQAF
jgi:short-subunit dehydrogenase